MYGSAPPVVTLTADDPGDPDEFQQVTSKVYASVDHLPAGHSASDLTATWTWAVVGVTHSDTVDGTYTTDGVDAALFSVTGDNADLTSPTATFKGEFDLDGFYEVEVQATVKYHDNRTGEDLGPYGGLNTPADIYLGDTGDEPPPAGTAAPNMTPAAVVTMRPNQVSGPPPGGAPQPKKIIVAGPAPVILIPGLDNTTKVNPGALVVLNVQSEGNSAPPQRIVVGVTHGKVGHSLTVTFTVAQTGSGVVRVYNADAKAYLTFNGVDNVFVVTPEAPQTLYVEGLGSGSVGTGITGYSSSMRDVVLKATSGGHTDKADMTVLWVDTPNFAQKDALPSDNQPKYDTGPRMGWLETVAAKVYPSTFSYPTISGYYSIATNANPDQDILLHLTRDNYSTDWLKNGVYTSTATTTWTTTPYGNGNDTSYSPLRHDFPSTNGGKIDDTDAAGLLEDSQTLNTIKRTRINFRAWAVVKLPSQQPQPIRCSPIMGYFNRFSMQNGSSGANANWHLINPPDIVVSGGPSDLQLDHGTTPVSADLR